MRLPLFRICLVLSLVVSFAVGWAQLAENPVVAEARKIGQNGLSQKAAPATSAGKFKPSGSQLFVQQFVDSATEKPDERKALKGAIDALIASYETESKKQGIENDAAASYGFSVSVLISLGRGKDMDEKGIAALVKQFQASFDTGTIRGASDKQKQEAYELSLCVLGLATTMVQSASGPEDLPKLKQFADSMLTLLIGADSGQISIKDNVVTVSPKGSAAAPTAGGLAPGFAYSLPAGWTEVQGWTIGTLRENRGGGEERRSAMVRFLPAIAKGQNAGDVLSSLRQTVVPAEIRDKVGGMVFRRYVGDGLTAQFIFGQGQEKGKDSDSLFTVMVIDCKTHWQPIVIAQTYEEDSTFRSGVQISARLSFGITADVAEKMLATFRCAAAKGQPLADRAALAGNFRFGSYSSLDYVNVYTGGSATSYVNFGGTLNLNSNGTFTYSFAAVSSDKGSAAKFDTQEGAGTWTIEGDLLVTKYTSFKQTTRGVADSYKRDKVVYRIGGATVFGDGTKIVLLKQKLNTPINAVTVGDHSDWYSTKKRVL